MNFNKFFLLFENFETVSKLFLDPQHRDKEWHDLQKEFRDSGGKHLGSGTYGEVLTHPNWPYVVKRFTKDDPYLKFARFAYKHPHKSFPKFYGAPQKIIPQFTRNRSMGEVYLSRIEKLNPIDEGLFRQLNIFKIPYDKYKYMIDNESNARRFYGRDYDFILNNLKTVMKNMPEDIASALDAMSIINDQASKHEWGSNDWKINNIMQRDNGDIVLIDPVWEGHSIYAAAAEQRRMDHDFGDAEDIMDIAKAGDGEDINPNLIKGGELPKKPKSKIGRYKPVNQMMKVPKSFSDFSPF